MSVWANLLAEKPIPQKLRSRDMHSLIEHAKRNIREWFSDQPRDLAIAVASLCREILDDGDLPQGGRDWLRLRQSFHIVEGQSIASSIVEWDNLCRLGDFDVSDHDAYVKLAIVTWTEKMLLKKLGMLSGPPTAEMGLEEWKTQLIRCLDSYIIVKKQRPRA
jgi:hypothetical protein